MLKYMIFLVVRFHPKRSDTKMTFMITESLGNKTDFNEPYYMYIGLCHFIGLLIYADIYRVWFLKLCSVFYWAICAQFTWKKITWNLHLSIMWKIAREICCCSFDMNFVCKTAWVCKTYCIYKNGINCLIDGEIHVDKNSTLHTSLKAA